MPVLAKSTYQRPGFFRGGHWQTIYSPVFRRVAGVAFLRERLVTPDDDFLDLDWIRTKPANQRLVILCHGLEGSSDSVYIRGMSRAFMQEGRDVLAWNYRGCSGEPNRKAFSYHSGATYDLETVVAYVVALKQYTDIALVGFSLGGNLILKYLGEPGNPMKKHIRRAAVFSVPCDLKACAEKLAWPENRLYNWRFITELSAKLRDKKKLFPDEIDLKPLKQVRNLRDFDDAYTAPLHGFKDALDYWTRCSSNQFISGIRVPTLLVNARNDPFLTPRCLPFREAASNDRVIFESPQEGGHVGFMQFQGDRMFWQERRAVAFIEYDNEIDTTPQAHSI
ncbi:MAG: alpha/beta fold hydrolase [Leptospiraceae bacterium]|nr:alpha/beta fold hydrolase [Leptospiraceae bacterium]